MTTADRSNSANPEVHEANNSKQASDVFDSYRREAYFNNHDRFLLDRTPNTAQGHLPPIGVYDFNAAPQVMREDQVRKFLLPIDF